MRDFLRKYSPIVLLFIWVVLSFFIPFPWKPQAINDAEPTFHKVLLQSGPQEKPRSYAYDAILLDSIGIFQRPSELTLYLAKDSTKQYIAGDILLIKSQIQDGRSYARWGQWGFIEHRDIKQISLLQGKVRIIARQYRDQLENRLHLYKLLPTDESLIESLVLGDRRNLTLDQREAFADAGAMHVLAVSGLHVGIIKDILFFFLTFGGLIFIPYEKKHWHILQRLIFLACIWSYAFLTGLSTPVLRSALMFSFLPLQGLYGNNPVKYNRLAAAALLILLINPAAICSPGFLFSFSAVLSLMYFTPRWNKLLPEIRPAGPLRKRIPQMVRLYFRNLILASFAAQIGTLPWTLLFFGQSANYFCLTNLIVIPLAGILICCAVLAFASSYGLGIGVLSSLVMSITGKIAHLMNLSVSWIQSLPGSTSFLTFSPILSVLLIVFILLIAIAMYRSSLKEALTTIQKKRRLICLLLASLIAAAMVAIYDFSLP